MPITLQVFAYQYFVMYFALHLVLQKTQVMTTMQNPFETLIRQNEEILSRLRKLEGIKSQSDQPSLPRYFNVEEIMEITGWSRATIYGKTHRRELPVVKAGKRLLFPAKDFLEHMESQGRPVLVKKKN